MPRRGNVPKREILPDPVYGSVLVTRLINSVMLDGKKGVAQKVVYGAFDQIKGFADATFLCCECNEDFLTHSSIYFNC